MRAEEAEETPSVTVDGMTGIWILPRGTGDRVIRLFIHH
jgi:hypothetical protein